jgi:hypothetical protein
MEHRKALSWMLSSTLEARNLFCCELQAPLLSSQLDIDIQLG